ncbi:hypothetical protein MMC24_005504 [Lignoscripta atroalba]|nr:hypothetical protein [Lignoscripta atroalba]
MPGSPLYLATSRPFLRRLSALSRRTFYRQATGPSTANAVVGATVAACVGVYAYTSYAVEQVRSHRNGAPMQFVERNFVGSARNIKEGRYWTLLTHTFTHFTLPHLAFNMIGLWSFGRPIVMLFGVPSFVALWIGSGVSGALLTLRMEERNRLQQRSFIGASGSVLGLGAVFACQFPKGKMLILPIPFPISNWIATLGFAAWSVYAQDNGLGSNIGHLGHLGGMAFGAVFWLARLGLRR